MTEDELYLWNPNDFRYKRRLLSDEAFAVPGEPYEESNVIDQKAWTSITSLSDDVSIRTSGNFGDHLELMHCLLREWFDPIPDLDAQPDALSGTTPVDVLKLIVYDQFQAFLSNILIGYYWIAIACLRGAIEMSIIGAHFEIDIRNGVRTKDDFDKWFDGQGGAGFGASCDLLPKTSEFLVFESEMKKRCSIKLGILDQKNPIVPHGGGWARHIYDSLSDAAHTRPHASSLSSWDWSNGPVFVPQSFLDAYRLFLETIALCRVVLTIAKPELRYPDGFERLLAAPSIVPSTATQGK